MLNTPRPTSGASARTPHGTSPPKGTGRSAVYEGLRTALQQAGAANANATSAAHPHHDSHVEVLTQAVGGKEWASSGQGSASLTDGSDSAVRLVVKEALPQPGTAQCGEAGSGKTAVLIEELLADDRYQLDDAERAMLWTVDLTETSGRSSEEEASPPSSERRSRHPGDQQGGVSVKLVFRDPDFYKLLRRWLLWHFYDDATTDTFDFISIFYPTSGTQQQGSPPHPTASADTPETHQQSPFAPLPLLMYKQVLCRARIPVLDRHLIALSLLHHGHLEHLLQKGASLCPPAGGAALNAAARLPSPERALLFEVLAGVLSLGSPAVYREIFSCDGFADVFFSLMTCLVEGRRGLAAMSAGNLSRGPATPRQAAGASALGVKHQKYVEVLQSCALRIPEEWRGDPEVASIISSCARSRFFEKEIVHVVAKGSPGAGSPATAFAQIRSAFRKHEDLLRCCLAWHSSSKIREEGGSNRMASTGLAEFPLTTLLGMQDRATLAGTLRAFISESHLLHHLACLGGSAGVAGQTNLRLLHTLIGRHGELRNEWVVTAVRESIMSDPSAGGAEFMRFLLRSISASPESQPSAKPSPGGSSAASHMPPPPPPPPTGAPKGRENPHQHPPECDGGWCGDADSLYHLLGLHDDEGATDERSSDPRVNRARGAFLSFFYSGRTGFAGGLVGALRGGGESDGVEAEAYITRLPGVARVVSACLQLHPTPCQAVLLHHMLRQDVFGDMSKALLRLNPPHSAPSLAWKDAAVATFKLCRAAFHSLAGLGRAEESFFASPQADPTPQPPPPHTASALSSSLLGLLEEAGCGGGVGGGPTPATPGSDTLSSCSEGLARQGGPRRRSHPLSHLPHDAPTGGPWGGGRAQQWSAHALAEEFQRQLCRSGFLEVLLGELHPAAPHRRGIVQAAAASLLREGILGDRTPFDPRQSGGGGGSRGGGGNTITTAPNSPMSPDATSVAGGGEGAGGVAVVPTPQFDMARAYLVSASPLFFRMEEALGWGVAGGESQNQQSRLKSTAPPPAASLWGMPWDPALAELCGRTAQRWRDAQARQWNSSPTPHPPHLHTAAPCGSMGRQGNSAAAASTASATSATPCRTMPSPIALGSPSPPPAGGGEGGEGAPRQTVLLCTSCRAELLQNDVPSDHPGEALEVERSCDGGHPAVPPVRGWGRWRARESGDVVDSESDSRGMSTPPGASRRSSLSSSGSITEGLAGSPGGAAAWAPRPFNERDLALNSSILAMSSGCSDAGSSPQPRGGVLEASPVSLFSSASSSGSSASDSVSSASPVEGRGGGAIAQAGRPGLRLALEGGVAGVPRVRGVADSEGGTTASTPSGCGASPVPARGGGGGGVLEAEFAELARLAGLSSGVCRRGGGGGGGAVWVGSGCSSGSGSSSGAGRRGGGRVAAGGRVPLSLSHRNLTVNSSLLGCDGGVGGSPGSPLRASESSVPSSGGRGAEHTPVRDRIEGADVVPQEGLQRISTTQARLHAWRQGIATGSRASESPAELPAARHGAHGKSHHRKPLTTLVLN